MRAFLNLFIVFVLFFGCKPQNKISGDYAHETECLGVELDGSQTLKTYGLGRNRLDAVEQAKKNAVRDVLVNGIRKGNGGCSERPILFEVNVIEKHEDYFNVFFRDGGLYKEFISLKDERFIEQLFPQKIQGTNQVMYGITVRVLRSELKKQMVKDKILNQ